MTTRAGFVALIGEPNAGKSTLTNRMVGAKVSIVTHKVQTTRTRIRGVALEGDAQIVFVDTPGLFKPRRRLDRAMVKAAWGGAADADIVVLLIEAHRGVTEGVEAILEELDTVGHLPARSARHQQDRPGEGGDVAGALQDPQRAVHLCRDLHDLGREGTRRRGSAPLARRQSARGAVALSRRPDRRSAHAYDRRRDDAREADVAAASGTALPLTVETESWDERKDGSARIDQVIYVSRDGHKGILLGHKGETVKAISKAAREELEDFLGRKVHLFLQVKVRERWQDEAERYSEMGLDFRDGDG